MEGEVIVVKLIISSILYLLCQAVFTSIFLGNLIVLLRLKIFGKRLLSKILSFISILLLIPVFYFGIYERGEFFNSALKIGFARHDKIQMKQQLQPYLQNLSIDNPRLIYIDHYTDQVNTFYYGNTAVSGFDVWILWQSNINFKREFVSQFIADIEKLKSSIVVKRGENGIFYNQVFYKPENFYAVLLQDRKVYDIKVYDIIDKVKRELGF